MARQRSPRLQGLAPLMEDRNQKIVAQRIGIDPGQLNGVIKLTRGASRELTNRLASYFGTTEEALIGVEGQSSGG